METLAVVIESSCPSSSCYESTELAHGEDSHDREVHEEKAEASESRKLAHERERVVEDPREEDDSATPASLEAQDLDPTWMTSMMTSIEKKLLVQPKGIKVPLSNISTSIYKVPHFLFRLDKNAYVPQVVSIGPLHYRKRRDKLQDVEEHKWRILNEIVSRKGTFWLKNCIAAVKKKEKDARECYSQVIKLNSKPFVEMMVLDGCFIIELFLKSRLYQLQDDPILKMDWLRDKLMIDLLMLENQIPFFILQTLFDLLDTSFPPLEVLAIMFFLDWSFCRSILPMVIRNDISNLHIHHLLHLLHEYMVPSTDENCTLEKPWEFIQCASKLKEAGIKFNKRAGGNFLDIKFEKGILEIPPILLEDRTNTIFRNLIAFEQYHLSCEKYITSYTYFMDCLINRSMDVEILVQKGIIKSRLGSDEDVALVFNNIHKEVFLSHENFYLLGICEKINVYCGTDWPKFRATLMHDYFKNPWAVISIVGGVVLLLLTMMQAFFSLFPKFAVGN